MYRVNPIDVNSSHMHLYNMYAYSFIYVCLWLFFRPLGDKGAASIWRWGKTLHVDDRSQFISNMHPYNIYIYIYSFSIFFSVCDTLR